ncbi:MAG: class I SAM-dependent rRNA methyltransferase [Pirellulales bacterium]
MTKSTEHENDIDLDETAATPMSAVSPRPSAASLIDWEPAVAEQASAQVRLKPRKSRPFFGRHPWVLDSAIASVAGEPADGDAVDLLSDTGKFIARGVFNSRSRIRVRLYSWQPEPLDDSFWRARLETALALRERLGYTDPEGGARLVFSEADGLSGLIVDRYADYLAVQVTSLAMRARLPRLVPLLVDLLHPRGIYLRTEKGIGQAEGLELLDGLAWGRDPGGPIFVTEHGLRYGVDLAVGQKTGFYLDQRENRRALAAYTAGARLLDMFCYSGGFSLTARRWGRASDVVAVDASPRAIALARANAQLNGESGIRFVERDGFEALDELVIAREKFGAVVLDPPKFARNRGSLDDALRAYHRLNRQAVNLLEPGGILLTCSCSGAVSREDFLYMLVGVAQQTGRDIQILEQRGAAPDHPVSATCLETEYLKCFICRVL